MATEKEALAELGAKIQARTNLIQSIKEFIQGLIARINDADDVDQIRAFAAEMSAQDSDLAQFIVDNTPAAPVANETGPAVEPTPAPEVPAEPVQ